MARLLRDLDGIRRDLDELRREMHADSLMTDQLAEVAELRTAALEELLYARWPRSIGVRRRLRRDLRASVEGYGWAGPGFMVRRFATVGDGWICGPLSPTGRHRNRGAR